VGLGSNYDGINFTPNGAEDVTSYKTIVAELFHRGYKNEEIIKIIGGNFHRVFDKVEKVSYSLSQQN
jgi:membrane dipeptidase